MKRVNSGEVPNLPPHSPTLKNPYKECFLGTNAKPVPTRCPYTPPQIFTNKEDTMFLLTKHIQGNDWENVITTPPLTMEDIEEELKDINCINKEGKVFIDEVNIQALPYYIDSLPYNL